MHLKKDIILIKACKTAKKYTKEISQVCRFLLSRKVFSVFKNIGHFFFIKLRCKGLNTIMPQKLSKTAKTQTYYVSPANYASKN
jgi:hypothetical protein